MRNGEKNSNGSSAHNSSNRPKRPHFGKKTRWNGKQWRDRQYWWDEEKAMLPVEFMADLLCHVKGEWDGEPFILQEWQSNIIKAAFGWKRPDGTRRFREVYLEVPRKGEGKGELREP